MPDVKEMFLHLCFLNFIVTQLQLSAMFLHLEHLMFMQYLGKEFLLKALECTPHKM